MKHPLHILSLAVMLFSAVLAYGQTPFDAFSPETSRPILDGDSIAAWRAEQKADTVLCAIVADLRHEQLLLVDLANESIFAYAPFTEEMKNWMSVDPLADKYLNVTPYLYCNGNPVMLVDPDGMDWYINDEKQIVWQDDPEKAPRNFHYIGTDDDLLAYYGLSSQYGEKIASNIRYGTTSGYYEKTGVFAAATLAGTARLEANVIWHVAPLKGTENNWLGRQFDGIDISASLCIFQNAVSGDDMNAPHVAALSIEFSKGKQSTGFIPSQNALWDADRFSLCTEANIRLTPQIFYTLGTAQIATVSLGACNPSSILTQQNSASWNLQTNKSTRLNYQQVKSK